MTNRWRVNVLVMPKPGVNDPEGEAILGGLRSLGYDGIDRVRAGRSFLLTLAAGSEADARKTASEMADRLLANPVIQSYLIESVEPEAHDGQ